MATVHYAQPGCGLLFLAKLNLAFPRRFAPVVLRRILIGVLIVALTAAELPARPAGTAVFGVVTQSSDAHIGAATLTLGSTIFDGDSLATGKLGAVGIRGSASRLYVPAQSRVMLYSAAPAAIANLNAGTLVFSATKASAIQIFALDAQICPAADGPTVGQISIAGPKLLEIFARRGALLFSYHGESRPISEGSSIRVVLDPPEDNSANSTRPRKTPKLPDGKPRGFLFLIIGGTAALTAVAIHEALESPDRP